MYSFFLFFLVCYRATCCFHYDEGLQSVPQFGHDRGSRMSMLICMVYASIRWYTRAKLVDLDFISRNRTTSWRFTITTRDNDGDCAGTGTIPGRRKALNHAEGTTSLRTITKTRHAATPMPTPMHACRHLLLLFLSLRINYVLVQGLIPRARTQGI